MNGEVASWLLGTIAVLIVLFCARAMLRLDKGRNQFRIVDLLLDPVSKQASIVRFGFLVALCVTSLVVLYGAISRTLTDIMYSAYLGAFAGVLAAKIISDSTVAKAAASPDSSVTMDRPIIVPSPEK